MNGGHFNGMDNDNDNSNHCAVAEDLRGRTRVVRRPNDTATDENTHTGIGGALKEEIGDDDDDVWSWKNIARG